MKNIKKKGNRKRNRSPYTLAYTTQWTKTNTVFCIFLFYFFCISLRMSSHLIVADSRSVVAHISMSRTICLSCLESYIYFYIVSVTHTNDFLWITMQVQKRARAFNIDIWFCTYYYSETIWFRRSFHAISI